MNGKRDTAATEAPGHVRDIEPTAHDELAWVGDTTIRETPGVCGGYPRVGHTRVSVRSIVNVYKETGNDFEQTAAVFNMLTREQVRAALDYYEAHPARVDEDIERNARAWAEITGQGWPD